MIRLCRHKTLILSLLLTVLAMYSATAAAISFQVVQHDSSQDKLRSSSSVLETALFDCFFDAGYVTTNMPTAISYSKEEDEDIFFRSLADSRTGFCNYLVMIVIEYNGNSSKNPDAVLLSNIRSVSWIVYDTASESLLEKGERAVGNVPDKSNNIRGVKSLAKQLSVDINTAMGKR